MEMTQLLYAFGIGISFSLGICAGAYLSRLISKIDAERYKQHNIEMLDIMRRNETNLQTRNNITDRMARSLDELVEIGRG